MKRPSNKLSAKKRRETYLSSLSNKLEMISLKDRWRGVVLPIAANFQTAGFSIADVDRLGRVVLCKVLVSILVADIFEAMANVQL